MMLPSPTLVNVSALTPTILSPTVLPFAVMVSSKELSSASHLVLVAATTRADSSPAAKCAVALLEIAMYKRPALEAAQPALVILSSHQLLSAVLKLLVGVMLLRNVLEVPLPALLIASSRVQLLAVLVKEVVM